MVPKSSPGPEPAPPGTDLAKTFAASLLALLAGLAVLLVATQGGHAFTTEALRRHQVARAAQPLADFQLVDSTGRQTRLHERLHADGRVWIVDFVYTQCQAVCSALGSAYQQLQQQVLARGLQGQVGLLSISFDPERDDAAALRDYARRLRLDPAVWRVVTLAAAADRRRLLDAFGIIVLPAPNGEFEHNAAFHIVNRQGQLVRIVDLGDPAAALDAAVGVARGAAVGAAKATAP